MAINVNKSHSAWKDTWIFDEDGEAFIKIPFRVWNNGTFKAENETFLDDDGDPTRDTWVSLTYHNVTTGTVKNSVRVGATLAAGGHKDSVITLFATSDPERDGDLVSGTANPLDPYDPNRGARWVYLPPGVHTVHVYVDPPKNATEQNQFGQEQPVATGCTSVWDAWSKCKARGNVVERIESNNVASATVRTALTAEPVFDEFKVNNLSNVETGDIDFRHGEKLYFHVNFSDSFTVEHVNVSLARLDEDGDPVETNWYSLTETRKSGASYTYAYTFEDGVLDLGRHRARVFVDDDTSTSENPAGNYSGPVLVFDLDSWPIQDHDDEEVVLLPANNSQHDYDAEEIEFRIAANESDTGYAPLEQAGRINISFYHNNATEPRLEVNPTPLRFCYSPSLGDGVQYAPNLDASCGPENLWERHIYFIYNASKNPPGDYRALVEVTDRGQVVKPVNVSYKVANTGPKILEVVKDSEATVGATGKTADLRVRASDEAGVDEVTANLSLPGTGLYCNATLPLTWLRDGTEETPTDAWWNASIPLGKAVPANDLGMACAAPYRALVRAGEYEVTITATDSSGVSSTENYTLTVNDPNAPSVSSYGVFDDGQAVDEITVDVPLTFKAVATDETLITSATAEITKPDGTKETLTLEGNQTDVDGDLVGNMEFTKDKVFPEGGAYSVVFRLADSAGNEVVKSGVSFEVEEVGPPNFEIVEPKAKLDAATWIGGPRPTLLIHAIDRDGVDKDAFKMTLQVAGEDDEELTCASSSVSCQATEDPAGLRITYTRPEAGAWEHGTSVKVLLYAEDLSPDKNATAEDEHILLSVDAKAPATRVLPPEPGYRESSRHVWNVSPSSVLSFETEDNSDVPASGVAFIHYSITGGKTGKIDATRSKSFDLGGDFGNGDYLVEYWGEDAAGNLEEKRELKIHVDGDPPLPDTTFGAPSGRHVNVSFIDRSGVQSAEVFYQVNDGVWQSLAMSFSGGMWRAYVDAGVNGDTVKYYVMARDPLGNPPISWGDEARPLSTFLVGNEPPRLTLTSPLEGDRLQGNARVAWSASDPEGDAVTVTVSISPRGLSQFTVLEEITDGSTSMTFDTTAIADGLYDLRVEASDGFETPTSTVTVRIANGGGPSGPAHLLPLDVTRATVGEQLLVQARVDVEAEKVEVEFYVADELYDYVAMLDDGEGPDDEAGDGVYSAWFTPGLSASYQARVVVEYREGGELQQYTSEEITFDVQASRGVTFEENAGLWTLIGILALAAIGLGAFALTRGRDDF